MPTLQKAVCGKALPVVKHSPRLVKMYTHKRTKAAVALKHTSTGAQTKTNESIPPAAPNLSYSLARRSPLHHALRPLDPIGYPTQVYLSPCIVLLPQASESYIGWMLRAIIWTLRATWWTLRAILYLLVVVILLVRQLAGLVAGQGLRPARHSAVTVLHGHGGA
eukprot:6488066-Pyramimonas_sp.AAC.2